MKITAVGDCAIQKNLPRYYDGFDEIKNYICRGDIRFSILKQLFAKIAILQNTAAEHGSERRKT